MSNFSKLRAHATFDKIAHTICKDTYVDFIFISGNRGLPEKTRDRNM